MRKKVLVGILLGVVLVAGHFGVDYALAKMSQDAPQATAKPSATPVPVVEEKKPKPVILEKSVLLELSNLELRQENARLKAEAAIPQSVKDEMKKIGEELDKFWLDRGIKREELATRWIGSKGVGGAIILTPVDEKPAPKAPEK